MDWKGIPLPKDEEVEDIRPSKLDGLWRLLEAAGLIMAPRISDGNMVEEEWNRQAELEDLLGRHRRNRDAGYYTRPRPEGNNKFTRSLDRLIRK